MIGFEHPPEGVIAYIKYYQTKTPTERQLVIGNETKYFSKVYHIQDRENLVKKIYHQYLVKPKNYDMTFQIVPWDEIKTHYRPEDALQAKISEVKHREVLPITKLTTELCEFLCQKAGVPTTGMGITGSQLINLQTSKSDIDVIVYGQLNALKIRQVLRDCFKENNPSIFVKPYNKDQLKELYKMRVDESGLTFYEFLKYEFRKLHQGTYKGTDFFIRFLEFSDRDQYRQQNNFSTQTIHNLGKIKISAEVCGDEHWWNTPAWIEMANITVEEKSDIGIRSKLLLGKYNLDVNRIWRTYTLRGRFIENIRLLERFEAYGTLELVVRPNQQPFLQIMIGTNLTDYLKLI